MTPDKCPVCNGANCLYRDGGSLVSTTTYVPKPKRFTWLEIVAYSATAAFGLMMLLMLIAALIEAGAK